MNKLGLFFCFLLAISYVQTQVVDGLDIDVLYDKFVGIAKGMAETTEYKCSNTLQTHKTTIRPVVEDIMKSLGNQQELMGKIVSAGLKLLMIEGLADNCNLGKVLEIIPKITKAEGIRNMGQNMVDYATDIEALFKEFSEAADAEGKNIAIGKIIRKITGLTFL